MWLKVWMAKSTKVPIGVPFFGLAFSVYHARIKAQRLAFQFIIRDKLGELFRSIDHQMNKIRERDTLVRILLIFTLLGWVDEGGEVFPAEFKSRIVKYRRMLCRHSKGNFENVEYKVLVFTRAV